MKLVLILVMLLSLISCNERDVVTLNASNLVNLRGVITEANVDNTLKAVKQLRNNNPVKEIYIVIESSGGEVAAGIRFVKELKADKNLSTITIYGASMASAIAQALPGKRYVVPNGLMMFHRGGKVPSMRFLVPLENSNATRIGITLEEYRMRVLREWYVKGEENLRFNTADKMVRIECDKSLLDKYDTITIPGVFFMPPQIIKLARCPLTVTPIQTY